MTLFTKYKLLWLAPLLVFYGWASACAQEMPALIEGRISNLSVVAEPGTTYNWKIFNYPLLLQETLSSDAEFVNGNQGPTVSIEWKKSGVYFFCVYASGVNGCTNLKVGKIQVIPGVIQAIAGKDTTIGACQSIILDGSKSIGNIASYQWSMLDPYGTLSSPVGINTTFTLSPSYPGILPAQFRVRLLVADKSGNTAGDTVTIKVDKSPKADVYISPKLQKEGTMLVDGSVSIGTALKYLWSANGGMIIGDNQQPVVTLNGVGMYSLEITDLYGCQSSKSFSFPLISSVLIANKDYGRTSWDKAIKLPVLDNDYDSANKINPGSVRITENPKRGDVIVNKDGTVTYSTNINKPGNDQFIYEVCDSVGLCDSALVSIDIYDATLKTPEGFSPNGDGVNDLLVFPGLENYPKSQLYVYTRSGQLVYQSEDYLNDWNGRTIRSTIANKEALPAGTYYYILKLGDTSRTIKGFVYIGY